MAESAGPEPAQLHDSASFTQMSRGPVSVAQLDQSALNYSGGQEGKSPSVSPTPAAVPCLPLNPQIQSSFYLPPSGITATAFLDPLVTSGAPAKRATGFLSLKDLKSGKIPSYAKVSMYVNILPDFSSIFLVLSLKHSTYSYPAPFHSPSPKR